MRILNGFLQSTARLRKRNSRCVSWPTKLRRTKKPNETNVLERSSTSATELITMNITPTGVILLELVIIFKFHSAKNFQLSDIFKILLTGGISALST